LAIDKINKDELDSFVKQVEQKFEEWIKENPKAKEDEKNRAHDRILQTYLAQFKGGTISDFFMGPIYCAMAEGRPVIIDEVNAIPHEVLISLNHILTRKVGDKINVQQNTGTQVEVKEGFGVMMTGNLNQGQEKYIEPGYGPGFSFPPLQIGI
jgi:MoxR-like ATPase